MNDEAEHTSVVTNVAILILAVTFLLVSFCTASPDNEGPLRVLMAALGTTHFYRGFMLRGSDPAALFDFIMGAIWIALFFGICP